MRILTKMITGTLTALAIGAALAACGETTTVPTGGPTGTPSLLGGCTGIACNIATCNAGQTTTLRGTVYDPAGKVPLYNVLAYVPNSATGPLPSGVSCDRCGVQPSGDPIVSAITDTQGNFVLTGVPSGKNIPLVIQVGKWRRQVTIPNVDACAENKVDDRSLTRLPRNKAEGDMPSIALTTGGADPLECLLRKIGIDDAEFTPASGNGRVHLYAGYGWGPEPEKNGATHFAANLNGGATFSEAKTLWGDKAELEKHDVVLLACEGQLNEATKPQAALDALYAYASEGGRVFASHWHRYWFSDGAASERATGAWTDRLDPPNPYTATVDASFPKGAALRDWLSSVGASTAPGELVIKEPRHNVDAAVPGKAQGWISLQNPSAANHTAVEYMTFNAPVDAAPEAQCGRVVYSDLHVSSGDQIGAAFPEGCQTTDLSPQEKALEFMLFDLSSCVLSDTVAPSAPR